MTVIVGGFAFVLWFVAIGSLATFLGFTDRVVGVLVASIFLLAIEVWIGHATVCLLSLSTPAAGSEELPSWAHCGCSPGGQWSGPSRRPRAGAGVCEPRAGATPAS